jgi:Tfp pilus assembly PilM family ATPase
MNQARQKLHTPNWSIGVELRAQELYAVCLRRKSSQNELLGIAQFKVNDPALIKKTFQNSALRAGSISASIEDEALQFGKIEVPLVPEDEQDSVVKWAVKSLVSGNLENYSILSLPMLGSFAHKDEKKQFRHFFAIEQALIKKRLASYQHLGIEKIARLEPSVNALAYLVSLNYAPQNLDVIVVLQVDSSSALLSVVYAHGLLYYQPLKQLSLEAIALELSQDLNVSAEEIVQRIINFNPEHEDAEILRIIGKLVIPLSLRVQEALENFHSQYGSAKISQLLLTGKLSKFASLCDQIKDTFNIATQNFDPLRFIDRSGLKNQLSIAQEKELAVSIGLAL